MGLTAFLADAVCDKGALLKGHALLAEDGKVKATLPAADVPAAAQKVKLDGLTLAPGLCDLQVNGGGGVLFNQKTDADGLQKISAAHFAAGTTGFLPTLISDSSEKIIAAAEAVREARGKDKNILGIHFEGPFLNPARKGVHDEKALRRDVLEVFSKIDFSSLGKVMITLAPELFSADELKALSARGVILCAGHSQADAKSIEQAKSAGLRGITHLFNAMGPINAREPGLAGIALNDDDLFCGIICDNAHVAKEMIRLAAKLKPPGKLFLVSDAMPPAGEHLPQGFMLYDKKIVVKNGRCETEAGALAGSALTLFECVQIAVRDVGMELPQALAMASTYPAQFIGAETSGFIAFDNKLNLQKTWANGHEQAAFHA